MQDCRQIRATHFCDSRWHQRLSHASPVSAEVNGEAQRIRTLRCLLAGKQTKCTHWKLSGWYCQESKLGSLLGWKRRFLSTYQRFLRAKSGSSLNSTRLSPYISLKRPRYERLFWLDTWKQKKPRMLLLAKAHSRPHHISLSLSFRAAYRQLRRQSYGITWSFWAKQSRA